MLINADFTKKKKKKFFLLLRRWKCTSRTQNSRRCPGANHTWPRVELFIEDTNINWQKWGVWLSYQFLFSSRYLSYPVKERRTRKKMKSQSKWTKKSWNTQRAPCVDIVTTARYSPLLSPKAHSLLKRLIWQGMILELLHETIALPPVTPIVDCWSRQSEKSPTLLRNVPPSDEKCHPFPYRLVPHWLHPLTDMSPPHWRVTPPPAGRQQQMTTFVAKHLVLVPTCYSENTNWGLPRKARKKKKEKRLHCQLFRHGLKQVLGGGWWRRSCWCAWQGWGGNSSESWRWDTTAHVPHVRQTPSCSKRGITGNWSFCVGVARKQFLKPAWARLNSRLEKPKGVRPPETNTKVNNRNPFLRDFLPRSHNTQALSFPFTVVVMTEMLPLSMSRWGVNPASDHENMSRLWKNVMPPGQLT